MEGETVVEVVWFDVVEGLVRVCEYLKSYPSFDGEPVQIAGVLGDVVVPGDVEN